MTQVKFDPTWNHIPRTAILYSLPLAMFSVCLYVHGGWIGWSRNFWVPFLWGLVIPLYNTRHRAGRGWALKDFMNRDMYPPTLALTYATAWYLSVTLTASLPLAMLVFFLFFHVFDGLLLHYEILNIYAISVNTHKRGVIPTLLAFGPWWYTYISCGFAAVHALGADTVLSIGGWSLAVMLPMQAALTWWLYYHDTPQWFKGITNVAVLGGGWSGIYTTKWLTECGLQATCFEATDHIGGVWKYREDRPGGVFKNTRATASKHFLHASDFPMDPATPEFPYHTQILAYLQRYVEHFGIRERFRLNTRIVHVGKEGEAWRVVTGAPPASGRKPFSTRLSSVRDRISDQDSMWPAIPCIANTRGKCCMLQDTSKRRTSRAVKPSSWLAWARVRRISCTNALVLEPKCIGPRVAGNGSRTGPSVHIPPITSMPLASGRCSDVSSFSNT